MLENFLRNELDRNYGLVAMAQASLNTIEDILDLLSVFKKDKKLRYKIHEIENIFLNIKTYIEKFKTE